MKPSLPLEGDTSMARITPVPLSVTASPKEFMGAPGSPEKEDVARQ
jgi:hypothetical protein